jgi:nucleolar protein 56
MVTHIGGSEMAEPLRETLRALRSTDRKLLREKNMELTKQQLRESVKPDLLIVNASNAIEEVDKVVNALVKRLREWYALHDPELEHANHDHRAFVEAVLAKKERAEGTMGGELTDIDLKIIDDETRTVHALYMQRDKLVDYLETAMQEQAPNVKRVAGATIGAKLMAMAGSLQRLSRMPASTVQLLGAETALFRHLRNRRAKPPKHGIIFNHILLQRAKRENRGKVARTLADKISIAAKVDFFKGEFIGDALYAQVEAKSI